MFFGITSVILVGLSWTISGWVMGLAPKRNLNVPMLLCLEAVTACVISIILGLLLQPVAYDKTFFQVFLLLAASGVINYFQLHFMALAMQKGPNGIIWSMLQSGFIVPFLMGVIFFHVALTPFRLFGCLAILTALFLLATGKDKGNFSGWKLYTLFAFLATGGAQALSNLPSYFPDMESVGSAWRGVACYIGLLTSALLMIGRKGFLQTLSSHVKRKDCWGFILATQGVGITVSYLFLFPGMDALAHAGAGAIAFPVMVTSCIAGFEIFSIAVLREKRTPLQWCALLLCLLGIVSICL